MLCTELSKSEDNANHVWDLSAAETSTAVISIETSTPNHSKPVSYHFDTELFRMELRILERSGNRAGRNEYIKNKDFQKS